MIPDPFEKKAVIPVRMRNGSLEFYYGGKLPALKEGTSGDLVVPFYALKDQSLVGPLGNHMVVPFLPRWTRLLAGLNYSKSVPERERQYTGDWIPARFKGFAEIILFTPLELRLRGSKRAVLEPCLCGMPALGPRTSKKGIAESINQAYTRLSEEFEQDRVSHAGNVFERVFYRSANKSGRRGWEPLKTLRNRIEAKMAIRLAGLGGRGPVAGRPAS